MVYSPPRRRVLELSYSPTEGMNGSGNSAVIAAESPSLPRFNDVTLRGVSRRAKRLETTLALAQKFQTGNV